ncbi:MAG: hypothetical protein IIB07_06940, partial [Bacteroidetes bacterium]|nr:hypothetical protein [Bacteroidota bacterium]
LVFRSTDDYFGRPPQLFNGEKKITFNDRWTGEKHIYIVQENPLPASIQMMVPYTNTSNPS